MKNQLAQLKQKVLGQLAKAKEINSLRQLEIKYLGRKGELTKILRNLAGLPEVERKNIGQLANEIKKELLEKFNQTKTQLAGQLIKTEIIDVTLPGKKMEIGHLHPLTLLQEQLEDLFTSMGFMVLEGPELESDYYNFEALNIPPYHPAREMQDTFYLDKKNQQGEYDLLLRTHTSPMQVRAMRQYGAPLSCVVPGRVFRNEATDACHEHTLYQLEGLMIDREISVANLIAVVEQMLKGILQSPQLKIRVRPGYFPFVEPGLEFDINCQVCLGQGCASCKNTGWMEMMGSGMVHPQVLRAGGLDPAVWSGFAFGIGIDRLAMMKYGINDIRLFESGDLRFLKQF